MISFRIEWFDFLAFQEILKSHHQYHNSKASVLQCSVFLMVQLSHLYMTTRKTTALSIQTSVGKLMSIAAGMASNRLILCHPLLLPPSVFPSVRVFFGESVLRIRWPKYWSFSFSINPSNEYSGLISFRMDWLDLLAVQGLSRVFSNTTVQNHQFFSTQLSSQSNSCIHT